MMPNLFASLLIDITDADADTDVVRNAKKEEEDSHLPSQMINYDAGNDLETCSKI